ncbi:MAG TPA: GAF domain-containing protein [Solirubrobacteraceae bacterium]|nr:GAF domain-containing protein [Solirubrobacteraceae bacterium]
MASDDCAIGATADQARGPSRPSDLRSIVDRTYEAFNARDFDAYRELLHDDVELIMSGLVVRGVAAVTDFVSASVRANPSLHIEPVRVVVEAGDTLVNEVRMIGATQSGDGGGPLEYPACGLYRAAAGRIVSWRVYLDPPAQELASSAFATVAAEQSSLRRVAELVAGHAAPEQVFALVTEELSHLLNVDLVRTVRFEPDGSATVMAALGVPDERFPPGTNVPLPTGSVIDQVFDTGAPARVDDYAQVRGPIGALLRDEGALYGAGGPIVVDGRLWGAMAVGSRTADGLPPGSEDRIAQFAELVSTAISNVESQTKVERLAAEQSALRRVATLVAREYSPDDLFAALAKEIGVLLDVDAAAILRYEGDGTATTVGAFNDGPPIIALGAALPLDGSNLSAAVQRTGMPQRMDDYSDAPGEIASIVRAHRFHSSVASPIIVEGATWGVIGVLSRKPEPLPPDTESRMAEFSRHAGMAVANAKSRADLAQSRARIVWAGDEARRRFERDLHDGAQQRLVSLGLDLRAAEAGVPPELGELRQALARLGTGLTDVLDDLRELSRGLHPAVLSEGGLTPALRALARRSAVPVDLRLELGDERFEQPVEVAAYYVASEALANTAKHADASHADVRARRCDGWLELSVSDDGRGGADAAGGSGLTGLVDRVEAIGGTIRIASPADAGTTVQVKLPVSSTR